MIPSSDSAGPEIAMLPDFWTRVENSSHLLLALDYDGTLAPFKVNPMEAVPLPGVREILEKLSRCHEMTLAVVSGRPVNELLKLLGDLEIYMSGSHGFEVRWPDGRIDIRKPDKTQEIGLNKAKLLCLEKGPDRRIEQKAASIALHTRGLPEPIAREMEEEIYRAWYELAEKHKLECIRFNGGVEIRARGRNKGNVVLDLLAMSPPEVFVVYIGDDTTDEDAFKAIDGRGIGIKVGFDPLSRAQGFLNDCSAVREFLVHWLVKLKAMEKKSGCAG